MTGMDTASWMPLIIFGSLMRETPPAARMSAGMRSSAMTAQAPASSAMLRLLGGGDVHDDAALEHLRELAIEFDAVGLAVLFCHGCSLGWHVHCLTEHPIGELGMTKYSVFEIITRSD